MCARLKQFKGSCDLVFESIVSKVSAHSGVKGTHIEVIDKLKLEPLYVMFAVRDRLQNVLTVLSDLHCMWYLYCCFP